MGNCLACFKDVDRTSTSSYKQQAIAGGAKSTTKLEEVSLNNNHHHQQSHPTYAPQNQPLPLHRTNLTNRDVLEPSEIQGLLGPVQQCKPDDTKGDPPPTTGSLNYGLKLLKKPINNILNTTTTSSSSSSGGGGIGNQAKVPLLSQISDNKINALFETYRDEECEDAILAPGIERLCSDLRYKPEDFTVLVLAWRLDASQMCRFTKAEFIQGLHTLNADSIETIRQRLEEEVLKLQGDKEMFKNLYRFTFRFGLEQDHRTLPLDMAISLWRLVFTVHTPEILDKWLDYLTKNPNQIRGIPKDTWNIFLTFADTCDIYSYSDEDAWPSVFDDFVEYENERRKGEPQGPVLP